MVLLSQFCMLNNSTSKTSNCFELKNVEGPTCRTQNIKTYVSVPTPTYVITFNSFSQIIIGVNVTCSYLSSNYQTWKDSQVH